MSIGGVLEEYGMELSGKILFLTPLMRERAETYSEEKNKVYVVNRYLLKTTVHLEEPWKLEQKFEMEPLTETEKEFVSAIRWTINSKKNKFELRMSDESAMMYWIGNMMSRYNNKKTYNEFLVLVDPTYEFKSIFNESVAREEAKEKGKAIVKEARKKIEGMNLDGFYTDLYHAIKQIE